MSVQLSTTEQIPCLPHAQQQHEQSMYSPLSESPLFSVENAAQSHMSGLPWFDRRETPNTCPSVPQHIHYSSLPPTRPSSPPDSPMSISPRASWRHYEAPELASSSRKPHFTMIPNAVDLVKCIKTRSASAKPPTNTKRSSIVSRTSYYAPWMNRLSLEESPPLPPPVASLEASACCLYREIRIRLVSRCCQSSLVFADDHLGANLWP